MDFIHKTKDGSYSNVRQPHNLIFYYKIHNFVYNLDIELRCNHDLQIEVFVVLTNASCCWFFFLPCIKGSTNYFNNSWLRNANIFPIFDSPIFFTHPYGGGKLMIISPSCLKVQRTFSKTWIQTKVQFF